MATFRITMKDPDYTVSTSTGADVESMPESKMLEKFLEWNEYITIVFDTKTGKARVVPVSELED